MSETGASARPGLSRFVRSRALRWAGAAAPALLAVLALLALAEPGLAQQTEQVYGDFPVVGPRGAVWIAAQLHLMFAAFVLGVPMFAVVVEGIGMWTGEKRYDRLSKEFTRLLLVAYSATAIWGAVLVFFLSTLYPTFWRHLTEVFAPTMWAYAGLFFFESFTLYVYYYGWNHMKDGAKKKLHLGLGVLLNVWGTLVLFIADSWLSYMMSPPSGVTAQTAPASIDLWNAVMNFTWMPINIHRLIANVVFGGAIVGAYAAYRFLAADSDEERAHYDWMGYVGNFIAIAALLVLPFAGYWLGREIYAYDQAMGITMMGGFMSWLWIIQAFLIGVLFLAGNYYLWTGMDRIPGADRFQKYTKYLLAVLLVGFVVWATPHTMIASRQELAAMGGSHHPFLNVLGVMSAKNTAVNFMILATFISFMLYRRANKVPQVDWAKAGTMVQGAAVTVAAAVVLFYGVYGYFVTAEVRIGFSVYQVLSVLAAMIFVVGLDVAMMRGAESRGSIQWGEMPERSQYALFILAVTFTWLMGLMGFARSGIRQHWHVYQTVRDTSSQAATPALGHAAVMISVCVLIFFVLVALIFWLGTLAEEPSGGGGAKAVEDEGGGGPGTGTGEAGPRLESAKGQVA